MVPTFTLIFLLLHLGHGMGDWLMQTDRIAVAKMDPGLTGLRATLLHIGGLAAAQGLWLALGALFAPITITAVLVALAVNLVSHLFIDWNRRGSRWWAYRTGSRKFFDTYGALHIDQALHYQFTGVAALLATALA